MIGGDMITYRPDIQVLDATIRDGGLVNDFYFTDEFVKALYEANLKAGVDYMEFGYKASKEMFDVEKFGCKWAYTMDGGEVGELAVKGPGVMKCYYNNPEATAEVLHDGWLYTGDMARQDEDGFYFLVDRKKDVVISGGENIYPVEIENFMSKFDKIKDVAVIGLPDKRLGEIATAIVELKQGVTCTEAEINEFCMGMPRYKRPRKIIFAPVPRNATGKIEKPKLRKMYCGDYLIEKENQG